MSDDTDPFLRGEAAIGDHLGLSKWEAAHLLASGRIQSRLVEGQVWATVSDIDRYALTK